MKKFISIILSAIIVFSVFTIGVSAEGATSGKCGDNLTWSFNKTTGVLTISGTGYMYNYDYNNEPPFEECPWNDYVYDIKKVIVTEGVKNIDGNAFYSCNNLSEVELPDGLEEIGGRAFEDCYDLESIVIPDSVTTIDIFAFAGTGLKSVTLPESLTIIEDGVFYYCDFKEIRIPPNVTSIGYVSFEGCRDLAEIKIPASVTDISDLAFPNCDSLESITVDPNNTVYSSDENGILYNKDKTTLIFYPDGNKQTEYVIPQGVTTIETGFTLHLTEISIPRSVKKIEDYTFYSSTSITDIYYEGSEAEWEAIEVGKSNTQLTNATIHFNSNHWDVTNTPDEENIFSLSTILEIIAEAFVIIAEICTKAFEFIINSITYITN